MRWPPSSSNFHLLQQTLSSDEDNKKTASYHQHTVQIVKPTKSPPPKQYNKHGTSTVATTTRKPISTTEGSPWSWTKVSNNNGETLELPHKNIPHIHHKKPPKQEDFTATPGSYFPSSQTASDVGWLNAVDQYDSHRRPVRPTRPARPPKPSQIITYFPGGLGKHTTDSNSIIARNSTTKFSFVTASTIRPINTSTLFPIIIRRTTKTPPTKRTTTAKTTTRPPTLPLSVLHTIRSPGDLSTTTASTARPPPAPALSASKRSGGCGLPQIKKFCPKARIVNGTQSCYGQFPWQVITINNNSSIKNTII